ncbi:MAG: 2-oxoacid:acceptor oxidoreductase subunit alpha, partial [Gammaproteobacteria bacterium]|nr:2-oxoacid:acceptor oxidoreductase subunit alpha [Gammaproteobacteria bacterium]
NQDTMDRHLKLMGTDDVVIFNGDNIKPGEMADGVELCPIPVRDLSAGSRNKVIQNTIFLGVVMNILDLDFNLLEEALTQQLSRKGEDVLQENINAARAGFEHSASNFKTHPHQVPDGLSPKALWTGNEALAMGGAAAGVKFYCAYPMSPSTGVLHWMANNARDLNIMVRQAEDEIAVANIIIGAAHTGARAMCATSGGGFALMTEAVGAAAMMEIPCVFINVMRAGPSTGVPTKTEQGDLWQTLGASQGDFERFIVAPKDALDAFNTIPEVFNLSDRYQCPAMVISDLLISEGTFSVDPEELNLQPEIDRGEMITEPASDNNYHRYKNTESGISPRVPAGIEGHTHVVATDEHDENGVLISDEFTDPHKRRAMVEKRARKFSRVVEDIKPPQLEGQAHADVTLIGWGSTHGVIKEAIEQLAQDGIKANQLGIKWIVPFHTKEITDIITNAKHTIIVENNYSGQFFRYLRSETGLNVNGHIRKYDGEPFMPHHIVEGVKEQLTNKTDHYVPTHEVMV